MKGVPVELWRWAGELFANGLHRKEVGLRLVEAGLEPALADEVAHDVGVIAALSLGAQLRREVGPEHLVEVRAPGGHGGPPLQPGVEVRAEDGHGGPPLHPGVEVRAEGGHGGPPLQPGVEVRAEGGHGGPPLHPGVEVRAQGGHGGPPLQPGVEVRAPGGHGGPPLVRLRAHTSRQVRDLADRPLPVEAKSICAVARQGGEQQEASRWPVREELDSA